MIAKEVGDIITDGEKQELAGWIDESDDNKSLYKQIKNSANFESRNKRYRQIDINAGWEGISLKMKKKRRLSVTKQVFRYAASFIAIFMLGLGGYFLYDKINAPVEVAPVVAEIKPGTTKATLILDGGERVNLDAQEEFSLTEKDGTLINRKQGQLDYAKAPGEEINKPIYNTVQIPRGGEFNLALSDGTHVFLNSMSQIRYPVQFVGGERRVELTGEAYFEVSENKDRPFIVETGGINIEVLGTEFNVNAYEKYDEIVTTLVEGKVRINSPDKKFDAVVISPNDQAKFDVEKCVVGVARVDPALYTAWKEGRFIFYDQRLEDIMEILTRWYSANVYYPDPSVKELRFSGNLDRYGSIGHILEIIKSTDKVDIEIKGDEITFYKK